MEQKKQDIAAATFAGGCFWCIEADFEKVDGVLEVISGYTGGDEIDPTYEQVSSGGTGHREAVQVQYDPTKVSYSTLLEIFWRHVDPTDAKGQFVDRGPQYGTAIFYHDEDQQKLATQSKQALADSGKFAKPITTPIEPLKTFYPAEGYHQDYYKENPLRYKLYRRGSGRDQFLEKTWSNDFDSGDADSGSAPADSEKNGDQSGEENYAKPPLEELASRLTPLQYQVTQEDATEPPFRNTFWDNHEQGIYVDIASGEPLFSSTHKFDSGSGWPSFSQPLESANVVRKEDRSLFMVRIEVRSKQSDSHLGHLFDDGPEPTGQRYCINSAALRFIPYDELEQEGYGKYRQLFE